MITKHRFQNQLYAFSYHTMIICNNYFLMHKIQIDVLQTVFLQI